MSDDLFKGIARFIDPSIRDRFGPTFRAAAQLLKPNPIINNPSTANLLRSPSLANLGKVLSDVAITGTEVLPGGKLITTPVKKASQLATDLIEQSTKKSSKVLPKEQKILLNLNDLGVEQVLKMTDQEMLDYMKDVKDIDKKVVASTATFSRALKKFKEDNKITEKRASDKERGILYDQIFSNQKFLNEIKDKTAPEIFEISKKYGFEGSRNNLYKLLDRKNIPFVKRTETSTIVNTVQQAIENLNTTTLKYEDIFNNPNVKKLLDDGVTTKESIISAVKNLQKKDRIPELTIIKKDKANVMSKLNIEDEVTKFLEDAKELTGEVPNNKILVQKFPQLKDFSGQIINNWRKSNKLMFDITKKQDEQYSKLVRDNPELTKFLEGVSPTTGNPFKYIEGFFDVDTRIFNKQPVDVKRTKLVQAHAIGGGRIKSIPFKDIVAIGRKVDYIPDKFIKQLEEPKFFLTKTGNDTHRVIEDNLVNDLVKKYKLLGYEHIDGAWKQTKKVNAKSVSKELKDLEIKISKHKEGLEKLDAYTLFYNPVTDKLVSYGQDIDKIPGLSNLINQVKKGPKKLRDGGIISMEEMIKRTIYERY